MKILPFLLIFVNDYVDISNIIIVVIIIMNFVGNFADIIDIIITGYFAVGIDIVMFTVVLNGN